MKETRIRTSLYPRQWDFMYTDSRFAAFVGGIGSGKTYVGAARALFTALNDGGLGMIVAPTYPMLRDATLRTVMELAETSRIPVSLNRQEMLLQVGSGQRGEMIFRSSSVPDRLRGPNLNWAWMDEGAMCLPLAYTVLIGRLRAGGAAGPLWITTTPRGRNWLWEQRDKIRLYHARTQDNPFLDREFIDALEETYAGKFAEQELGGAFVGFDGLVYELFDDEVHITERAGPWQRVIAGVDEGYTNPAVILVVGLDNDDRAHVLAEYYERRVLQADFVAQAGKLQRQHGIGMFYVDPSAAGLIADMRSTGLPVQTAKNDVLNGIRHVQARLAVQGDGRPRLTIDPECANVRSELLSYVWRERSDGTRVDQPEKANDHAMDALRYALYSAGIAPPAPARSSRPRVSAPPAPRVGMHQRPKQPGMK